MGYVIKVILLLGMPVFSFSQTVLTGYITIQNSGNISAFPVQVKSFGATETIISGDNGYFRLLYNHKLPGDDVELVIEKKGYEVVNKESLLLRLPHPSDLHKDVRIYLCKKGEWRINADRFYNINLIEISNGYRDKIKELEKKKSDALISNEDFKNSITLLERKKRLAEAQAQDLAERFAKANLDDASERYKKAYYLFEQGNIDSVLIILNEELLKIDLIRIEREIEQGEKMMDQGNKVLINGEKLKALNIEQLMLKANSYAEKENWQEANRLYLLAVKKDSLNIELIEAHISFLYTSGTKSRDALELLQPSQYILTYIDNLMKHPALEKRVDLWQWYRFARELIPYHPNKYILEVALDRIERLLNEK